MGAELPVGGGGIAKMQSFRTNAVSGYSFSSRVPCWLPVTPNFTAGAASITTGQLSSLASNLTHEFGHTLALWHDGNDGVQPSDNVSGNYYPGHGTAPYDWSPIMGGPYRPGAGGDARSILQWAKNDYPGANNSQDDLAVLAGTANGFGYAADEPAGFSIPVLAATGTSAPWRLLALALTMTSKSPSTASRSCASSSVFCSKASAM